MLNHEPLLLRTFILPHAQILIAYTNIDAYASYTRVLEQARRAAAPTTPSKEHLTRIFAGDQQAIIRVRTNLEGTIPL